MKCGGLGIPNPWLLEERENNISKVAIKVLVGSLLIVANLNCVAHKGCVRRVSADGWKQRDFSGTAVLTIMKELVNGVGLNRPWQAMENGAWLMDITHQLNGTELSREESKDNLLLQYIILPLNLPTECDGCGKKFSVPHALSCPKGGLVLSWNNDSAKEWGTL